MLKASDLIVISAMNRETGLYYTYLVTNRPRWEKDKVRIYKNMLINIEIFPIGSIVRVGKQQSYFSVEEFEENEINI